MTKMRPMSVFLILLSCGFSLVTGVLVDHRSEGGTANYRAVYYGARCLIQHKDPYQPGELAQIYNTENGEYPSDPGKKHLFLRAVLFCVNLPTTLFLLIPLALLPWSVSHILWLGLIALGLTLAALLAFDLSQEHAAGVSLFLICVLLANSEILFAAGNTAGIALSLCVIAVWCFVKRRFEWFGILSLALSLSIKPHDSGLIWLWLVFIGGSLRKRALQTLVLTAALAALVIGCVGRVAPLWRQELIANLANTSAHGDISDPGPSSIVWKSSADAILDLQTVFSVFHDDPRVYNPVTYLVCGALLTIWGWVLIRVSKSSASIWYALASVSALSMLGTYHRPYDGKLLLLAVPACAMLWSEGGWLRKIALTLTAMAAVFTGDIPLAIISILERNVNVSNMGFATKLMAIWLIRPAPLALLGVAIFYLWVFVRRATGSEILGKTGEYETEHSKLHSSHVLERICLRHDPGHCHLE